MALVITQVQIQFLLQDVCFISDFEKQYTLGMISMHCKVCSRLNLQSLGEGKKKGSWIYDSVINLYPNYDNKLVLQSCFSCYFEKVARKERLYNRHSLLLSDQFCCLCLSCVEPTSFLLIASAIPNPVVQPDDTIPALFMTFISCVKDQSSRSTVVKTLVSLLGKTSLFKSQAYQYRLLSCAYSETSPNMEQFQSAAQLHQALQTSPGSQPLGTSSFWELLPKRLASKMCQDSIRHEVVIMTDVDPSHEETEAVRGAFNSCIKKQPETAHFISIFPFSKHDTDVFGYLPTGESLAVFETQERRRMCRTYCADAEFDTDFAPLALLALESQGSLWNLASMDLVLTNTTLQTAFLTGGLRYRKDLVVACPYLAADSCPRVANAVLKTLKGERPVSSTGPTTVTKWSYADAIHDKQGPTDPSLAEVEPTESPKIHLITIIVVCGLVIVALILAVLLLGLRVRRLKRGANRQARKYISDSFAFM